MKPTPTRTTNPLPFTALEPHRFEDLIRQLAYDFRTWVALEAIGRSGDDAGTDIRGIEALSSDEVNSVHADERVWLIQVKREKTFGPRRAEKVAEDAVIAPDAPPHGFILAVSADVSRTTRERLAERLRARGVRQIIVWGLGELEDMLFDPLKDHLLFAYFGISLRHRRRSLSAELRQRHAIKRQLFTAIGGLDHRGTTAVLVRDPTVEGYPLLDRVDEEYDVNRPPWLWTAFEFHSNPDSIALVFRRHHAWLTEDGRGYDVLEDCSHVMPYRNGFEYMPPHDEERCECAWRFFYNAIPEDQRAWVLHVGWILLDDVLMVDDLGDIINDPPHILATRGAQHGFFSRVRRYIRPEQSPGGHRHLAHEKPEPRPLEEVKRVSLFPDPLPDVEWRDGVGGA